MKKPLIFIARLTLLAVAMASAPSVYAQAQVRSSDAKAAMAANSSVTQIDIEGLKKVIKPNGKPLLVNFWATWCDPCRDEFPDLVKIDGEYRGKIDFVVVSLDDLAEINRDVPKFLLDNKAQMPAYLLKTPDEDAAIATISKDWTGNLPMTILFSANGDTAYIKKGIIKPDVLRENINKALTAPAAK